MIMMNQNFLTAVNRMTDLYQRIAQQNQAPPAAPMLTAPPENYPRASTGIGREMLSPIPPVQANVDLMPTELTPAFRPPPPRKRSEIAPVEVYVSEEIRVENADREHPRQLVSPSQGQVNKQEIRTSVPGTLPGDTAAAGTEINGSQEKTEMTNKREYDTSVLADLQFEMM